MRRSLVPALCALFVAAPLMSGCSFEMKAGGSKTPEPAATPAPTPAPAPTAEAPKRAKVTHFEKKGEQLTLPGPVVFQTGSDVLAPESDDVLTIVYNYLKETPKVTLLRIEGHTDNTGDPIANQTLSEKRAMSVARWLTAKGINCNRLLPVGFGQAKPVAGSLTAQTPDEKSQNRRVSFFDAAIQGKPIAGKPVDNGGRPAGDPCNK